MKTQQWKRVAARAAGALALVALGYGVARGQQGATPAAAPLFYAGTLEQDGKLVSGEQELRVALYPSEKSGAALCESTQRAVVDEGRFRVALDDARCGTAVGSAADLWSEVQLNRGNPLPRARIGSVPYARVASRLDGTCIGCVDGDKLGAVPAEKISGVLGPAQGGSGEQDAEWTQALPGTFGNYGRSYAGFGYRKEGQVVRLQGLIEKLTSPTFLTLPEGYRPRGTHIFAVVAAIGGAQVVTRVDVTAKGEVLIPDVSDPAKVGWIALTGITFRVD